LKQKKKKKESFPPFFFKEKRKAENAKFPLSSVFNVLLLFFKSFNYGTVVLNIVKMNKYRTGYSWSNLF
jgi:hypothetical protein